MSYTVHMLILSYGFFIVSGCDLVCGVPCTWRGLCLVMWSNRTNCYVRLEDSSHWENPSEWKRGCGAIWWLDMWYSAVYRILFDCMAYYWVVQDAVPDWSRFPKWECSCVIIWLYGWTVIVGFIVIVVVCPSSRLKMVCAVIIHVYTLSAMICYAVLMWHYLP